MTSDGWKKRTAGLSDPWIPTPPREERELDGFPAVSARVRFRAHILGVDLSGAPQALPKLTP